MALIHGVEGRAHHPAPSPTPNASAPRPSGQTPASGSRHNSPEQATANTRLATSNCRTRPWLERTRSSLRGSTNSRRATASRENTCSGSREGQTPVAGGATRPKHESICSRTARSGKASRRLLGGGRRRNRPGQRPVQDLGALRRRETLQQTIVDFLATTAVGQTAGEGPGREWERENVSDTLHRWRRKRGRWERGRKIGGGGLSSVFSFSFPFLFHVSHRKAEGGRGGHIVTGTLAESVVAGKKQKKKKRIN